jgi:hypothetical protein
MSLARLRHLSSLLAVLLALPLPVAAFESPLSDTAVREAYFLGQRHDATTTRFFDKYTRQFTLSKTNLSISSISFLTPYALVVQHSSHQGSYSAQQAEIDHRSQGELVRVVIQAAYLSVTDSNGYTFHPTPFWKDFDVQVFDKHEPLKPLNSKIDPIYLCSEEGGCTLTGATLTYDFSADAFTTDIANIRVVPPQGDISTAEFDLDAFR